MRHPPNEYKQPKRKLQRAREFRPALTMMPRVHACKAVPGQTYGRASDVLVRSRGGCGDHPYINPIIDLYGFAKGSNVTDRT
jgi:hypothetical protein